MKALDIAYYFLFKANQEGDLLTNLKLQKLLYYAQAWHLVNFDKPLFNDTLYAWDLGPVVKEVYQEFKRYKGRPIPIRNESEIKYKIQKNIFKNRVDYLNDFYDAYIGLSAHELVNMAHNEDPWKNAYISDTKIINIDLMKDYYKRQYKESE